MNRRLERVSKELKNVIAQYVARHFSVETDGLVSINFVVPSQDLKSAEVHVGIFGSPEVEKGTLVRLNDERVEIQSEIAYALKMRNCPKLKFVKDHRTPRLLAIEKEIYRQGTQVGL